MKKWIPCNNCGAESLEPLYQDELENSAPEVSYDFTPDTRKTFAIVRCSNCGLIFTNPMPNLDELYVDTEDKQYLASQDQRRETARRFVQRLRKHVTKGKLLDIGCATGILLDEASSYFDVEGVELSDWARKIAAANHSVHDKPISVLEPKNRYDVITLMGVIEHFDDPRKELQAVWEALRPGGMLVVYTGDVDAWLPRLLGKRWWWFQGMHLYYFSRITLTSMLKSIGFKIVAVDNYTLYFQLFSLATSLNRYVVGRWLSPILTHKFLRNMTVRLKLSGEMLMYVEKP